ncbi:MAG: UbiD family decarboxylase [Chloroflexi bacterium]|nr:UbiD family decarboxylase [Chloroflexota bacterium]
MDDLRTWLDQVETLGDLVTIEGADWNQELGAIAHVARQRSRAPAVMFDAIPGYARGFRVLAGMHTDFRRFALTSDLSPELSLLGLIRGWRDKIRDASTLPPVLVDDAPFFEHRHEGNDVNVLEFPVPFWHEGDGGRYLGTGAAVITRDPEEGWVNLGTYRLMVQDEQTLGLYMAPTQDGRRHMNKYFAQGQACPVAISIGHHPLVYMVASMATPRLGMSEYDYAGGLAGRPVPVVNAPITGLPVPASAEIVLEGEVTQGDLLPEGPFGETTGYYASGTRPEPVIRIKAVYHRSDPILASAPTAKPVHEHSWQTAILTSARIWNELEQANVPGIQGVYRAVQQGGGNLIVVSVKQQYAGHARQAAYVAANSGAGAYRGKFVVVVDEDIDPTNLSDVLWAVLGRCDPAEDIEIMRRCVSGPLDPLIPRGAPAFHNARAMVDACRPWEMRQDFPKVAVASASEVERAEARWGRVLDTRSMAALNEVRA